MKNTYAYNDIKVPGLTREIVDALDKLYPERCPDILDTDRQIWSYVGSRSLVRFLRHQLEVTENAVPVANLPL